MLFRSDNYWNRSDLIPTFLKINFKGNNIVKKIINTLFAIALSATISTAAAFEFNEMYVATPVEEGISGAEVDQSIKDLSVSEGILHVAMFPLSKQVAQVTGKPFRHLSIHNICDAKTASILADINDAFVIVMPCRIAVVEGKDGKVRLWSMNPAMITKMAMPEEARQAALIVAEKMNNIIAGASEGAF